MTNMIEGSQPPQIGDEQVRLLERLSNACAVSGDEGEVRKIVLEEVQPHANVVTVDALGNVLATRYGSADQRIRVMLAAHMDEVGLMLTHDEGDGIFRFETVGGISLTDLPAKLMWVSKAHIPGVIGTKPVHLTEGDERKRPFAIDDFRLDMGAGTDKVKVGDWATFATSFIQQGSSLRGKALDDRLGVATLIELVKHAPPQIDLQAAFTVQE
ncbi:MAG: hypothetical protein ACM3H7_06970, partial [Acidobacteriaceae bacterium]